MSVDNGAEGDVRRTRRSTTMHQELRNFAIVGVGGYVAPRHLQAIREVGGQLIAAADPRDSVGILDQFSSDVRFFTEIDRLDRHLEKLRRGPSGDRVHYLSVCSPNHLHDAHCRLGLRLDADVICEKPLVVNPWNLDALEKLEEETHRRIATVLQLRLHPKLLELRADLMRASKGTHDVELTYVTVRGPWYDGSWKGAIEKSGGVVTNIGVHLFDLVLWLFGAARRVRVHMAENRRFAGFLELERANVRWFLSTARADDPSVSMLDPGRTRRSIRVDGREVEFSQNFDNLHTRVYEETLAGRPFRISDARSSIELAYRIRTTNVVEDPPETIHPTARRLLGK